MDAGDIMDPRNPPELELRKRPGTLGMAALRPWADAALSHLPEDRRNAALALVCLWQDHWKEAHALVQTREGERDFDWVHAIGHRREGDYGNAAYWFRRVGTHPAHAALTRSASESIADPALRRRLLPRGDWSPMAFLKAVEENPEDPALRSVQAVEFLCLFRHLVGDA